MERLSCYCCKIHRRLKQSYFERIQKHLLSIWGDTQGTLGFKFTTNKSSNKKGICKDTGKKRPKITDALLSGAAGWWHWVWKRLRYSVTFLRLLLDGPSQSLEAESSGRETSHAGQTDWVTDLLSNLDMCNSMALGGRHLWTQEQTDLTAGLFTIISERSWWSTELS